MFCLFINLQKILKNFLLNNNRETSGLADISWENLGFNPVTTDFMYVMKFSGDGEFLSGGLQHFGNIELNPASCVLNYGQVIYSNDCIFCHSFTWIYLSLDFDANIFSFLIFDKGLPLVLSEIRMINFMCSCWVTVVFLSIIQHNFLQRNLVKTKKINLRTSTRVASSQHQARLENLGINTKWFKKFQ